MTHDAPRNVRREPIPSGNSIDLFVGSRVRMTREFRSVSLSFLANSVGMDQLRLRDCEQGAIRFRATELYSISAVLGVNGTFFFPSRISDRFCSHFDAPELDGPANALVAKARASIRIIVSNG